VTSQEVEDIKGHFDKVAQELRTELRGEIIAVRTEAAATAQGLREEIAGVRTHTDLVAQEIRSEMRGEFAKVRAELSEFRRDAAAVGDHLMEQIVESRRIAGVEAESLRSEMRTVAEGVALANARIDDVDLRVDRLTTEVRRGFAEVRTEIHRLHATDDELRRRIDAQEQRGA
jgi:hypothetical protein